MPFLFSDFLHFFRSSSLFLHFHEGGELSMPQMQLFSFTFLDLRHTKEEDLHLPQLLFVILDQFRDDCISKIDCTNFHTYSD